MLRGAVGGSISGGPWHLMTELTTESETGYCDTVPALQARIRELMAANAALQSEVEESRRKQAVLHLWNRAWRTRTLLLQAVNECTEETDLVRRVCRAMVEEGEFELAWVAYASGADAEPLQVVTFAGPVGTSALDPWAETGLGAAYARLAMRSGQPTVCQHLPDRPQPPEWREWAVARGLGALAGFPLIARGVTLGAVVVYGALAEAFEEPGAQLVQQGANGLAQGVAMLRARAARVAAEDALHEKEAELARVTRVTTVGELTASIAHEINQPLAAVVTHANACVRWLAPERMDLEEARLAAQRIARDGNRAAEVIARIRALLAKGRPESQRLELPSLIHEILPLVRGELRRRGATLECDLANSTPWVQADRVQIQQVLMNLIINALEAMSPATGRPQVLTVRTRAQADGSALVAVQDSGEGLDAETAGLLFNAFYTTKAQGLGMGLSISRSIVEAHGGRLWAIANPDGCGATFQFTLPVASHETEEGETSPVS